MAHPVGAAIVTLAMVAATAGAGALLLWPPRPDPGRRLRELASGGGASAPAASRPATSVRRPLLLLALLATPAGLVVGIPWWLLLAALAALVGTARRAVRGRSYPELPLVLDLVASCLAAGAAVPAALVAAAAAAGDDLRRRLDAVAGALRDGAEPAEAWRDVVDDAQLGPLARCLVRSSGSGAAAAAETARLAARTRTRRRAEVQQRAARTSIWIVLPLGTCFLPAFVLVGVVPVAIGLLHRVL